MVKRLVVTGYRPHELGIFNETHPGVPIIKEALRQQLLAQLDEGLEWVIVSGQLGVEAWTCDVVRELKEEYTHLKYAVLLPFQGQEERWNETNKAKFEEMVLKADFSTYLTNRPYAGPWQFQKKDEFLFENSDGILFVYDEENEGSPKFTKRAAERFQEQHPYELFVIDVFQLQLIQEDMQREQWD